MFTFYTSLNIFFPMDVLALPSAPLVCLDLSLNPALKHQITDVFLKKMFLRDVSRFSCHIRLEKPRFNCTFPLTSLCCTY